MATSDGTSSLHTILDSLERGNKQDCIDFSQGHLNENKLLKFSEKSSLRSWPSAQKGQIAFTSKKHLMKQPINVRGDVPMQDAMLKFSIGTNGTIPVPPIGKKPEKSRSSIRKKADRQSSYLDDGVLIEELTTHDPAEELSPRVWKSPRINQNVGRTSITKRDQYLKRRVLETDLIRKQDTNEQNILSGFKAVEHLEQKLKQKLAELHGTEDAYSPNFHRLQIYGNVFEELISESTIIGPILKTVKKEYDDYMAYLLDNNPTQHQLLKAQIQRISERKVTPDLESCDEKRRLASLESEAEKLLKENKRLREELSREKSSKQIPVKLVEVSTPEKRVVASSNNGDLNGVSIADKVQSLRSRILQQIDEIEPIRKDLRQNYVPAASVIHMENCVKELELQNQVLGRKNEGLEESIHAVVENLAQEIKRADTSESDRSRIWRRLMPEQYRSRPSLSPTSSRSILSTSCTSVTASTKTHGQQDSDTEEEDEVKWNWYIS